MPDSVLQPAPVRTTRRAWRSMNSRSAARSRSACSGTVAGEIARKVGFGRTDDLEDRLAVRVRELRYPGFCILIDVSVERVGVEALRYVVPRRVALVAPRQDIREPSVDVILRVRRQGVKRARVDEIAQRIFEQASLQIEIAQRASHRIAGPFRFEPMREARIAADGAREVRGVDEEHHGN